MIIKNGCSIAAVFFVYIRQHSVMNSKTISTEEMLPNVDKRCGRFTLNVWYSFIFDKPILIILVLRIKLKKSNALPIKKSANATATSLELNKLKVDINGIDPDSNELSFIQIMIGVDSHERKCNCDEQVENHRTIPSER
ncbi:hypothetical protein WUBG_14995 [Wuchereria bancrofti]|uniref:Uncharacterized protein n=1 Tax=Wuchereria bancrofti TaxID=6293 RepID=J9DWF8_WUCBA|nr:hypothetical protein WUBG_14995 [Wuchereria bancrofti]